MPEQDAIARWKGFQRRPAERRTVPVKLPSASPANSVTKPTITVSRPETVSIQSKAPVQQVDIARDVSVAVDEDDTLFGAAVDLVLESGTATVSLIQRRLKLGYSRAATLVDRMESLGIVGPFCGAKPRILLVTHEQWQKMKGSLGAAGFSGLPVEHREKLTWQNWLSRVSEPSGIDYDPDLTWPNLLNAAICVSLFAGEVNGRYFEDIFKMPRASAVVLANMLLHIGVYPPFTELGYSTVFDYHAYLEAMAVFCELRDNMLKVRNKNPDECLIWVGPNVYRSFNMKRFRSHISIEDIDTMDGHEFERVSAWLLTMSGFTDVHVTQDSNDQGVDILAMLNGEKWAIQCKRYKNKLGNKPIQEVFTGSKIYGCQRCGVLTNSYFTKGGIKAAQATGVKLWDRNVIINLIQNATCTF